MRIENKVKRAVIFNQLKYAEDSGNYQLVRELGKQLEALEEAHERKTWNKLELTVDEYLSYKKQLFTDRQIAYICDVHEATIKFFKQRNNIKTSASKLSEQSKKEILALSKQGVRHNVIARKFNIDTSYVTKLKKKAGE